MDSVISVGMKDKTVLLIRSSASKCAHQKFAACTIITRSAGGSQMSKNPQYSTQDPSTMTLDSFKKPNLWFC